MTTRRKPVSATGALALAMEQKHESKRIRALRRQNPELEIVECSRDTRMKVQEIQENAQAEIQELAEQEATDLELNGQGFTFQVSEGVFTRPKQERRPARPGRRKP